MRKKDMSKLYHLCISAGNEVMHRSQEDYIRDFNCFAIALHRTGSKLLADSFMSTHHHSCVVTDSLKDLVYYHRTAYTRYFNRKYHRKGRLGERIPFITDVVGVYHRLAALSYTLRNALHHGISPTPFGYPHNSANVIFQKELGKSSPVDLLPRNKFYHYLPDKAEVPEHYIMSSSGLLLRESVIDVQQVEYFYNSPRNFLFYMNRISGEEWEKEQEKEGGAAYTIESIENGVRTPDISSMLKCEHGRENYRGMSDILVCELIDNEIIPRYGVESVYQLSYKVKIEIANELWSRYHISRDRIKRCLGL